MRIKTTIVSLCLCFSLAAQRADNYKPDVSNVQLTSTNLPIVLININKQQIDREDRVNGQMVIIDNGNGQLNYRDTINHPSQHLDYRGHIGLKYRGNSSFTNSDKKPYSIRTQSSSNKKQPVSLLDMGEDSDWVLLAPYSDRSMMRDLLIMQLSRPYFEYVPSGRYCELILDNTYYGVYILSERVRVGDHRLPIGEPGESGDALTGGYHVEVDRQDEQVYISKFAPKYSNGSDVYGRQIAFQYKWPEYSDMTDQQKHYIHQRIDQMEESLKSPQFADPTVGYAAHIDVNSFIDYMIATELARNVDGYRLSTNLYKYRDSVDSRFKMSLWDFNIAFGNADYAQGWTTDTWAHNFNDVYRDDQNMVPFWWSRLQQDPNFVHQLKQRWSRCRLTTHSDLSIMNTVDSLYKELNSYGAQQRNSIAWPRWDRKVWPNYYLSTSYSDEIGYLKNWIRARLLFLDTAWKTVITNTPDLSTTAPYDIYVTSKSIHISKLGQGVSIEVYDIKGCRLHKQTYTNQAIIPISVSGVYLIQIVSQEEVHLAKVAF